MVAGQFSVRYLDDVGTVLFTIHIISELITYVSRMYFWDHNEILPYTVCASIQCGINVICLCAMGYVFNNVENKKTITFIKEKGKVQFCFVLVPLVVILGLSGVIFFDSYDFLALAQFFIDSCGYSFLSLIWFMDLTKHLKGEELVVHGRRRVFMFALFLFFFIILVLSNFVHESKSYISEHTEKYLYSVTEVILLSELLHVVLEGFFEATARGDEAAAELSKAPSTTNDHEGGSEQPLLSSFTTNPMRSEV